MSTQSRDGARLRAWRKSLPQTPQGREISHTGLSNSLGWSETRWGRLEEGGWRPHHRAEVEAGVRAIVGRMDVPPSAADEAVDHILNEGPAPELGPWLEGQCPAPPMGRPKAHHAQRLRSQPTSRLMRSVIAIIRTATAGNLGEEEAAATIIDLCSRDGAWNMSMLFSSPPSPSAA